VEVFPLLKDIKWIFFDVGSTIVDESKAYERRIEEAIKGGNVTYEQFYKVMVDFYKQNKKGDLEALKLFGFQKPAWHKEEERLYPQTENCLRILSGKYKIGIIANQSLGTEERLRMRGILEFIDLVIASAEEGVAKPDPKIFRIALERAGCVAENTVMVGDRLDNDIAPAKRLGMKTIRVKQGFGRLAVPLTETEIPDYSVNDLDEVCRLFENGA